MNVKIYPDLPQPPQDGAPPPHRRWRWLFVLLPLLACAAIAVGMYALGGVAENYIGSDGIPVTGARAVFTPSAQSSPTPGASRTLAPGESYTSLAKEQLTTCLAAFHEFLILEETGAHQPDTLADPTWRDQVSQAIAAFRAACQPLSSLPAAPAADARLEHWLKLAAAEVGPVTDDFSIAVDKKQVDAYNAAMDHLDKFVQYANNAELILSNLEQMREL